MGNSDSRSPTPRAYEETPRDEMTRRLRTVLELKRQKMLQAAGGGRQPLNPAKFNRIVLQFPKVGKTFLRVRKAFQEFDRDGNGTIEYSELAKSMRLLGLRLSPSDVRLVFHEADFAHSEHLDFRQFLLCLALGYLLKLIPGSTSMALKGALSSADLSKDISMARSARAKAATGASPGSAGKAGGSGVSSGSAIGSWDAEEAEAVAVAEATAGSGGDAAAAAEATAETRRLIAELHETGALATAFDLALESYVLFDPELRGYITQREVQAALRRMQGASPSKHSLSHGMQSSFGASSVSLLHERFSELDWNHDGKTTFTEFLYAFEKWCGVEDEDEEEDADPHPHPTIIVKSASMHPSGAEAKAADGDDEEEGCTPVRLPGEEKR